MKRTGAGADADRASPALQALAASDLDTLVKRFTSSGMQASLPGPAMLHLQSMHPGALQVLLSVGVHGNETAPISMLASVLDALAAAPRSLGVDLLVVVGNPAATGRGTRFIDADLNRLFTQERVSLNDVAEATRADQIMQASADFFAGLGPERWHLDLHSAIRPSRHARFAVIPACADDASQEPLMAWLGSAAIEAAIFNSVPASTFSAYTARRFGVLAATVELGQVGGPGQVPTLQLRDTQAALLRLLQGVLPSSGGRMPTRYRVAQEIIKHSDAFVMPLDASTHNFTAMAPGSVIATDGAAVLRVGASTEYVVFPNPGVLPGQRAGLMVVRIGESDHGRAGEQ